MKSLDEYKNEQMRNPEFRKAYEEIREKNGYIDAIIKVKVPEWQIGEEVSVFFPDTMNIKGVCEREI